MVSYSAFAKSCVFLCLTTFTLTTAFRASGQTLEPDNPLINEPLEKYGDPPAYIYRVEPGPRMVVPFGPFISYQANVDANQNNIIGDAANEPSIAVDLTNPNRAGRISIGWRQFDSVSSNFRQGGWGYTNDAGVTWHFTTNLEPGVFRSDPVLVCDETGKFFYNSLLQSFCDDIWRSLDGGQSWMRLPSEGGALGGDKQWYTVDKTNGIGHGFQYQWWSPAASCSGTGLFNRSTNGGTTWGSPISVPNSARWGTLDVASNGNLFLGGNNGSGTFYCIRSSNAQNGSVTPSFDQTTTVAMGGSLANGAVNPGGLTGQTFLAVDRSGGPTNNNIYMMTSVRPSTYTTGNDVMFVRSTNGGTSFSAPVRVNDDATTNKWHWFGTFAVAPNGRLDAVWLDTRNDAGNLLSQLFYSYSIDAGVTWSANVAVSPAFNPTEGYPNQNKIGDYMTIVSDNNGGNVAYPATFNLNPNLGAHEQDIYFVHVQPPSTIPQSAVSRKTHGAIGHFDVDLPLSGPPGIECRTGGATHDYTVVVTFGGSVSVNGTPQAQITAGIGAIGSNGVSNGGTVTVAGSTVTIPLTNVANAQTLNVTLNSVNGASNVTIPMSVLVGDVGENGIVNASDVTQAKIQLGLAVTGMNFRSDVNANGSINGSDVSLVKANVGAGLP
jgi:hypothetical protein